MRSLHAALLRLICLEIGQDGNIYTTSESVPLFTPHGLIGGTATCLGVCVLDAIHSFKWNTFSAFQYELIYFDGLEFSHSQQYRW